MLFSALSFIVNIILGGILSFVALSIINKYKKSLVTEPSKDPENCVDKFKKRQSDYTASWDIGEDNITSMEELFPTKTKKWAEIKEEKMTSDYSRFRHTRKMGRISSDTNKPYQVREREIKQIHAELKKTALPLNERWTFMNKHSGFESNYLQILTRYESLDKYVLTTEEIDTTTDIMFDVERGLNLLEELSISGDIENIVTLTNDDGSPFMISRLELSLKTILRHKHRLTKIVTSIVNKEIIQLSLIPEESVTINPDEEMKKLYYSVIQRGSDLALSASTIEWFNNSYGQFILQKLLTSRLPELWESYSNSTDIKAHDHTSSKFIIDVSDDRLSRDELFIKSINKINSIFDSIEDTINQQSSTNELSKLNRYFSELEKSVYKG